MVNEELVSEKPNLLKTESLPEVNLIACENVNYNLLSIMAYPTLIVDWAVS